MGYDIGSPEWFLNTPAWGFLGVVGTILRLLEKRAIPLGQAHDLLYRYWEEIGERGRLWIACSGQPGEFERFVRREMQAPWHEARWEWEPYEETDGRDH
jgi:hypothetical protein